jgi:hypothetical protein
LAGGTEKGDETAKKKAAERNKKNEPHVRGNALVLPGSGLGALMTRTMVTSANIFSRSPTPSKCFGTLREALGWLQSLAGQSDGVKRVSPTELESLVAAGPEARAA